jgi:site-specific DNA recombinase
VREALVAEGLKRAVIYARISKDATGEEAGVQRQVEACTHLALAREWQLVGDPVIDNDISAYNGAARPGWVAILGMIARREVDVVITSLGDLGLGLAEVRK